MAFGTVKKKREATIILRILPEEKTAIAGEAGKAGLTVSASGVTSNPAIWGHFKTGHRKRAKGQGSYTAPAKF